MDDDERLREALLELELLRERESKRLVETQTLLAALEAMTTSEQIDDGINSILQSLSDALDCQNVLLLEKTDIGQVVGYATDAESIGARWDATGLLTRPRRFVDLQSVKGLWGALPEELARYRSMVSIPLPDQTQGMVLAAFSDNVGRFRAKDTDLLTRIASVVSQGVLHRSLEGRNSFLAEVIDRSPVSVAIAEARGELPLVYVNDAFVELTGYERAEILGENCRMLTAEEPSSEVRTSIRRTVAERDIGSFTLKNRRKDGSEFWNDLRLFPILGNEGDVTHMVATQTDATQRVQAEVERDEARRRLEGALTATTEGFLVLGALGHVRFVNETFRGLFREDPLRVDELLPDAVTAMVFGYSSSSASVSFPDILRELKAHEIKTKDGRHFQIRPRLIPTGGVVVAASDITQVKVNQKALRQRLAAIERSQDGIAIGDSDGRLIDANPSLLALWSFDNEAQILGRKWTSFYDASSVSVFSDSEAWFRRKGVWRGEVKLKAGGGLRIHDVSASLVPDVGSVLIIRDITERRRNTEERADLRRRLDRAQMQERLHRVSAGLAHDFNNLLTAILGSASLIDAVEDLPMPARSAVDRIQTAAQRAADLTDSFLDLGSRDRSAENIELGAILRNTVDLARGGAPSGVRLTASLQDTPIQIQASQTDILQVVMNLVVNGIDACEGKPGEVRVSVSKQQEFTEDANFLVGHAKVGQHYLAINVEDTGKGMSPETVATILEPYFTTKGNKGTGLGLDIVGSIIEENNALLEVQTELGNGAKFTVWWPMKPEANFSTSQSTTPKVSRENLPILVLDDVPDVSAAIARSLEDAGFEVAEINDPAVAVEAIAEDPDGWGCLVSDYDMPRMNGGDVLERLSTLAPNVPIIIVSALARRLSDTRLSAATSILQKPVQEDKLIKTVRQAVLATTMKKEP